jgi:hypothetical protein
VSATNLTDTCGKDIILLKCFQYSRISLSTIRNIAKKELSSQKILMEIVQNFLIEAKGWPEEVNVTLITVIGRVVDAVF